MAVVELLRSVPDESVLVQTDSQYVVRIFTEWLPVWRAKGMRTSKGKPVENSDLIEEIDRRLQARSLAWEWVRGHSGHDLNEVADGLAFFASNRAQSFLDHGHLSNRDLDPPRLSERAPP